jgi:flagellin-like protein
MKKAGFMRNSQTLLQSRKGISPLIATVLLIAFAVALGAVVMSWGRGYIENTATFAEEKSAAEMRCTMDVELDFAIVNNQKKVCYDDMTELDTPGDVLEYPDSIENTEEVDAVFDTIDPINADQYIDLVVENGPSTNLEGLQITILGKDEIVTYAYNQSISPAGLVRIQLPWDSSFGTIEQVKVLPRIYVGGADTENYCVNSAIISSYILECDEDN